MEALVIIHTNQRIFWRDRLPSDPVQYSRSYERATGVSEAMEQRRRSSSGVMMPKKLHERGIGPVSVVSAQYHNRFCFTHDHRVESLPDVERILNHSAEDEIENSLRRLRLLEALRQAHPRLWQGTSQRNKTHLAPLRTNSKGLML